MPSRRFPQRLILRLSGARGRELAKAVTLLTAGLWLGACASGQAPVPARDPQPREEVYQALPEEDRAWLIDPLEGSPQEIDPARGERLRAAWRLLLERSDVEGARAAAAELLATDPNLAPAQVLAAQADFAEGLHRQVIDRLLPVSDRAPAYAASQLLLGRAAEEAEDVPLAYAAYRAIGARNALARQRLGEIHPRAVEILSNRLRDALRGGRLDEAERSLGLLQSWAPSELATLEAARELAVARSDQAAELAAVKNLAARKPEDRGLLERRAELELSVGDPGAGLQIVQELVERYPNDPHLAQALDMAKFRWRLSLLPRAVQEVAAKPDLNKADLATLVYWLVPNVRYARPTAGRIATDVLDHPQREEIVRMVNLGLMEVDSLHRFSPRAPLRRGAGLRVLVRTLSSLGQGLTCLGEAAKSSSQGAVCTGAAGCGLLAEGEECQPGAALSGAEAVELLRRTLKVLGTP
jgi:hypothetical protein